MTIIIILVMDIISISANTNQITRKHERKEKLPNLAEHPQLIVPYSDKTYCPKHP